MVFKWVLFSGGCGGLCDFGGDGCCDVLFGDGCVCEDGGFDYVDDVLVF